MDEIDSRTEEMALPRSKERLIGVLKEVLDMPGLDRIEVTPDLLTITRRTKGQVLPEAGGEVDVPFLLERIANDLQHLEYEHGGHPFFALRDAMFLITGRGLRPNWIVGAQEWVDAYFDMPAGTTHLFGAEIVRVPSDERAEGKIVVIGSASNYITDAEFGVIIDMGI